MNGVDATHDPALPCWVAGAARHPQFPVQNLPLGVFSPPAGSPRIGTAIGDHVLDLSGCAALLPETIRAALAQTALNTLFALPLSERLALRRRISALLSEGTHRAAVEPMLHAAIDCSLHLPCAIGDYTDFYVGIHHAENIGRLFRPDAPLLPNYKWVPIGYHGRASSVRASGVPVIRPNGQRKGPEEAAPSFGPSRRLDHELELGVWIAGATALGEPVAIDAAPAHVAGLSLLNDWSARDLQAWEYQPLGPFLAKNFHTSVSPWVVTAEALAPFHLAQPPRPEGDPQPMPYLWSEEDQAHGAFAIELTTALSTPTMRKRGLPPHRLSRGPATSMYWTVAQIVTHHASNGCNLNAGDLLGTGTISSGDRSGLGSLMEITLGGAQPFELSSGETRTFLEDGDELVLAATARAGGAVPIGFGECRAIVVSSPVAA